MMYMDTKECENDEMLSISAFMFNRKYKIHCIDNDLPSKQNNISLKDYKFYNKRLLNFYKTLLLTKQCNTITCETREYINNIPIDLIDLGTKFIEESVLFFKREDKNEIIQKELSGTEYDIIDEYVELMENTNDIDMKYYNPVNTLTSNGTFQIIEENDDDENSNISKMLPQERRYHLRDNSFRLKGISRNNNMSILYETDEAKKSQTK